MVELRTRRLDIGGSKPVPVASLRPGDRSRHCRQVWGDALNGRRSLVGARPARRGRPVAVKAVDEAVAGRYGLWLKVGQEFNSASEASVALGLSPTSLGVYLSMARPEADGCRQATVRGVSFVRK